MPWPSARTTFAEQGAVSEPFAAPMKSEVDKICTIIPLQATFDLGMNNLMANGIPDEIAESRKF
jgi:hypothetical protein